MRDIRKQSEFHFSGDDFKLVCCLSFLIYLTTWTDANASVVVETQREKTKRGLNESVKTKKSVPKLSRKIRGGWKIKTLSDRRFFFNKLRPLFVV